MTAKPDKSQPPSKLLAYLRLFRLPNVFTAMADVTMGMLFVRGSLDPVIIFVLLLAASSLLYTAGMVLNDVCDIEVDARERPFRPLPSGQISLGWATWLGYEMLLVGVALAGLAGFMYPQEVAIHWRSGVVALAIVGCVILYDTTLKKTLVGPVAMGACRFLNVLLGMSVAGEIGDNSMWRLGFDTAQLIVAGGVGVYIVGVTLFARSEAKESSQIQLFGGIVVMLVGIGMLAFFPDHYTGPSTPMKSLHWQLLLLLLTVTIARRCLVAALNPHPQLVQAAVKQCILSLIILDASVCLAVQPNEPYWAIGVLTLLAPTMLLGKWVYST